MTPSPPRSIPRPPLEKIELSRISLPVPAVASTSTPMPALIGDRVAGAGGGPADRVVRRSAVDEHAGPVAQRVGAGDVGADQVALDQLAGGAGEQPDAGPGVARDDVAGAGRRCRRS